jgi:hypothetical protein
MNYYKEYWDEKERILEDKMNERKKEIIASFSSFVDTEYVDRFVHCFAYAWDNGDKEAINLADQFSLNQEDLFALLGDHKNFEKELIEAMYA